MAMEMLNPVTEGSFGKGMKEMFSDERKAGDAALKEARKLKKEDNKSAAKKKYQEALKHYQKIQSNVSKIEDDDIMDWFIHLFLTPWWIFVMQVSYANFDIKGLTRQSTMRIVNDIINLIKKEMNSI